jgi:hypothetical protein
MVIMSKNNFKSLKIYFKNLIYKLYIYIYFIYIYNIYRSTYIHIYIYCWKVLGEASVRNNRSKKDCVLSLQTGPYRPVGCL